ncbi:hypothetical protein DB346_21975 [Verrucomicrobia bacterium LW23]|nr:hypothetical protein DB346_21975 [Verrucomicrobia bacterium LW23]
MTMCLRLGFFVVDSTKFGRIAADRLEREAGQGRRFVYVVMAFTFSYVRRGGAIIAIGIFCYR